MDMTLFAAAVVFIAVLLILYRKNQQLQRQFAAKQAPGPRKGAEEQRDERLSQQLEAVMRETVKFSASRVMGRGEYEVFRAALNFTRQSFPAGPYPFYVFPQVSLGQIIRTTARLDWQADQAHRAINSKRCDLLIADRHGNPVAVLEYQGSGHDIGGTAERRDRIKRIALERAGVRYVEIRNGATPAEIQQTIRTVLTRTSAA
ncbi:MAG: DUF2726 domain-containing protein [Alphaproteobacteria bacterium]|nr:DUF2726 domain-containing protein [Alphaproteobacteria bacterium]